MRAFEMKYFILAYVILSPAIFMAYHKYVLKEKLDGDYADQVTFRLQWISIVGVLGFYAIHMGILPCPS